MSIYFAIFFCLVCHVTIKLLIGQWLIFHLVLSVISSIYLFSLHAVSIEIFCYLSFSLSWAFDDKTKSQRLLTCSSYLSGAIFHIDIVLQDTHILGTSVLVTAIYQTHIFSFAACIRILIYEDLLCSLTSIFIPNPLLEHCSITWDLRNRIS